MAARLWMPLSRWPAPLRPSPSPPSPWTVDGRGSGGYGGPRRAVPVSPRHRDTRAGGAQAVPAEARRIEEGRGASLKRDEAIGARARGEGQRQAAGRGNGSGRGCSSAGIATAKEFLPSRGPCCYSTLDGRHALLLLLPPTTPTTPPPAAAVAAPRPHQAQPPLAMGGGGKIPYRHRPGRCLPARR